MVLLSLAFLLIIADLLTQKKKRRLRNISFLSKIERVSRTKYVKWMQDKPNSKGYKKTQKLIRQAGFKISPEAIMFISYILPVGMFLFILAIKYTNIINTIMNIEQLKEVAKVLGDKSIAEVDTSINWGVTLAGASVFYFAPKGLLKLVGVLRSVKSQKEVIMLQTYTIMMLKTGKAVKQILITLMDRASNFKPALENAVNSFSQNPALALKELREDAANKDFEKIVTALEQTLKSDRKISLKYLENHRILGKELNRINRRGRNAKKSMVGILLMIIPLLTLLVVGGYPWLVFALKVLDETPI